MRTLIRDAEVEGTVCDVLLTSSVVTAVGDDLEGPFDDVVDAVGGALLPGLHDHHLHLLAMAAAHASVDVSAGLEALRVPGEGWLRAVGWTGEGDRHTLDAVVGDRPVRVQHRSGALWVLSSAALRLIGPTDHPGVERDEEGEPTGRLWRADDLLAERAGRTHPDLEAVGRRLASFGVTGVTDATPDLDTGTCVLVRAGVRQHVLMLGDPDAEGPRKLVIPDHALPSLDDVVDWIRAARPRAVAVHCVTRESLLLLLAALDVVGRHPRDRVEHASLVPLELADRLPAVVTQPGFLSARGDDYLDDVEERDQPDLYRYGSLLARGCHVVPSSDAPYGPVDPWLLMRAARDRRAGSGRRVGDDPGVGASVALDGLLRPLEDVTARARRVVPGSPADLVLLHVPLAVALADPDASVVRRTWIEGEVSC